MKVLLNTMIICFLLKIFCWLSLIPYMFLLSIQNKKKKSETTQSDRKLETSSHNGIGGVIGRTILSYYRYVELRIGYCPFMHIRKIVYKYVLGVNYGKNVVFHYGTEIRCGYKIEIQDGTVVGDRVVLDGRNGIVIGDNVNISTGAQLYTQQHDYNDEMFSSYEGDKYKIVIGDNVWISTGCIILPGVTVGTGAVIAAGAIVTRDVEPYTVVGGIPAKKIGERKRIGNYNLTYPSGIFW